MKSHSRDGTLLGVRYVRIIEGNTEKDCGDNHVQLQQERKKSDRVEPYFLEKE